MSEVRIQAEQRTEFGKGASRRIRRANMVPAVLYGHGEAPRHLSLPGHDLLMALKTPNVLLSLDLEQGGNQLALAKDVQRDPIKGFLEHVDLVAVRRGERVTISVPVVVDGDVPTDNQLTHDLMEIQVEAEATHLPEPIHIKVDEMESGTSVHARELPLPAGVTLVTDPDALVISLTVGPSVEQLEADLAGAEADLGIVHEVKDEDAAEDATPAAADEGDPGTGDRVPEA